MGRRGMAGDGECGTRLNPTQELLGVNLRVSRQKFEFGFKKLLWRNGGVRAGWALKCERTRRGSHD
jgi:hypothetical protein